MGEMKSCSQSTCFAGRRGCGFEGDACWSGGQDKILSGAGRRLGRDGL